MSWNSVKKDFNWPSKHMNEAITDPEITSDVMQDTGRDVTAEALNPNISPSMHGLELAAGAGAQAAGSYAAQAAAQAAANKSKPKPVGHY